MCLAPWETPERKLGACWCPRRPEPGDETQTGRQPQGGGQSVEKAWVVQKQDRQHQVVQARES